MDFRKIKKVHLTGIKGVGMTSLALYLSDMGIKINGSDVSEKFVTDEVLEKHGIVWSHGINAEHVKKDIDLLITTAAHGGLENEEVKKAKNLKIPVITYAEALAELSYEKEVITVCGVGGKSSISSMLSVTLDSSGLLPSYIVGVGNIYPINTSGRYQKEGRNFICEADEYVLSPGVDNRPKFSLLKPKIIIATNVEYDHPDIYPDFEKTKEVFLDFFAHLPKFGFLVANSDNKNTMEVAKKSKAKLFTYGRNENSDYHIRNIRFKNQKTFFNIYIKKNKKLIEDLEINVPGEFNVSNAAATYAAGDILGISADNLKSGLARYLGCRRRFEDMGSFYGANFYDDYAHHPGEIAATLKAARDWYPGRRIVAIFQPHTYSRTKALLAEFAKSFKKADVVCLMDIYSSARETLDPTVSTELLIKETLKYIKNVHYTKDHESVAKWIVDNIQQGDVVLTMGAGDIFHLYTKLKEENAIK